MPVAATKTKSIYLIGGADEFSIKETAAKLADKLAPKKAGEFGLEIIEGSASNQDEALKVLSRLREALNTVGLFGGGDKLVWLKNTDLLADNPMTRAESVKESLAELADLLKAGLGDGVTLLISAIGTDRRKTLYKTLEKVGEIQFFEALEEGKGDADEDIEAFIQSKSRADGKTMSPDAVQAFRELVAPNLREIANELEKLFVYVGKRTAVTQEDVRAICSASRQAVIWELTDALGARRTSQAIHALENLLDAGEQPIGVLMMLVAQFRLMLLARDLMQRKLITARDGPGRQLRVRESLRAAARTNDRALSADEGRRAAQCLAVVPLRARREEFLHVRIDPRHGFAVGSEPPARLHTARRQACLGRNNC